MIIIISLTLGFASTTMARTVIIPGDYPTIQEGIDSCSDGDTVLVEPGTYVENINFNGHNIVLGSLFLTTGDTTYIEETVIDGDSSGPVITVSYWIDSTATITGFSIQNGVGQGIRCNDSNPNIIKNIIRNINGNGISCNNSNALIFGCSIIDNVYRGIGCYESDPRIFGNLISGNTVGGIYCYLSNPIISNNIISNNSFHL